MRKERNEAWCERASWGAVPLGDGTTHFRLWAPAQEWMTVTVGGRYHAMARSGDGWFEAVAAAAAGQTYAFRLMDGQMIADPASAAQAGDIESASLIVDHDDFQWRNGAWAGRPWEEAILYELHVGTFTPAGTFRSAIDKLGHLAELGVTAIEIMPVAQFSGARGWGYDGVLLYAPHVAYGTPDDLKSLVDAAHGHGLMVILDVVYNHFGPVGNALPKIAPAFFHAERHTPWGAAIDFEESAVRRFFLDNATMWIADYRFDGLRFDAIDHIDDDFVLDMAGELRRRFAGRHLHLVVEDADDRRRLVEAMSGSRPQRYTAGWNDDLHHALHVISTGESTGHYAPFAQDRWAKLARAVAGFTIAPARGDAGDGEHPLPPQVHVNFLQNHDQAGNRAFGERLISLTDLRFLEVMTAMLLLIPQVPLLFMGEEYGEINPFHFFADLGGETGEAVRKGRIDEAENFGGLPEGRSLADLPDPLSARTFGESKLDWSRLRVQEGAAFMARLKHLIGLRNAHVLPLLRSGDPVDARILVDEDGVLAVDWHFPAGVLALRANLAKDEKPCPLPGGPVVYASDALKAMPPGILCAPSIVVSVLGPADTGRESRRERKEA